MKLREMMDYIVIQSGQFLIGVDDIEIDFNKFEKLVKIVLGDYNRYVPISRVFHLDFGSNRKFTFTDETVSKDDPDTIIGIPRAVTSVTPTEILGSAAYNFVFSGNRSYNGSGSHDAFSGGHSYGIPGQRQVSSDAQEKIEFPWVYRKPSLWIPYGTGVEIKSIHSHTIQYSPASPSDAAEAEVETITYDDVEFLEMLRGRFMMSLGSSRRAFTVQDFPIENDGDLMYNEGRDVYQVNRENLVNTKAKFYEAYGD